MLESRRVLSLLVSVVLVAGVTVASDDAYIDEIRKYREGRVERQRHRFF